MPTKFSNGFTLVELMVAISIVAILSTVGLALFSSAQGSARDAKRKADLEDIKKVLYEYKAVTGSFCPGSAVVACAWAASATSGAGANFGFDSGGTATNSLRNTIGTYFKKEPHDPKWPTLAEDYYLYATYENFVLSAKLEKAPSPAMTCTSGAITGPATGRNYCITE